jgi:uncharacterized protein involved in response to NO
MLGGAFTAPTAFSPLEWHVHELVYGYVSADGYPELDGRLPVTGGPLLALVDT